MHTEYTRYTYFDPFMSCLGKKAIPHIKKLHIRNSNYNLNYNSRVFLMSSQFVMRLGYVKISLNKIGNNW